ncbi:hypothetical protein [Enterococcus nangangensis]|uniref:hypothetical protein n=1 Tax=Enterococcus nangangensis TaxID=2559926 RepID=UPI0010F9EE39|nr:hypothetical protein [Enterococcus nangangensis]
METIRGTAAKVKMLKLNPHPLLYCQIDSVNCLVARDALNFLAEVTPGSTVILGGDWNKRHQFIVKRFCVLDSQVYQYHLKNKTALH